MINLKNVTLRRGANVLLENVNWTIYHKQRIGVIGANGSGKTSFFSLLLGEMHPDVGDIEIPRQLKLGHVEQEHAASDQTAVDYVLDGDKELRDLEKALKIAEDENDGMQIGSLHEKLGIIDAYTAPSRAAQLLSGLGFTYEEQQKTIREFSGGWRVRLNLAKALMSRSDVLLLDEPTNHLDLDAVLWLEEWLKQYSGTLLMISHDRDFLDVTVDHIAHLHNQQIKVYSGDYSTFEKQRATDLAVQHAAYEKQQKQIAHMQSFVNRFRAKASKARQAQSRMKAIERLEIVSAVQADSPFQFSFINPDYCPNPLITLDHASIAYGEKMVLKNLNFSLTPKDRIAFLGPNGAGKSSLIKLLARDNSLDTTGTVTHASGIRIGYFAQHQVDHLSLDESPLQHLKDLASGKQEQQLRQFLGRFGFSGEEVLKPIKHFSGGEKSRLALALIVWQKPNLLLLDEPTNHLDLEMRNALSLALQEYEGAMILVSHDRFLVRTTTDQLYLIANHQLQPFDGDLDDYQKWLFEFRRSSSAPARPEPVEGRLEGRPRIKPLLQRIEKLESSLSKLEKEATEIESLLADGSLYEEHNKGKLQELLLKQAAVKKEEEKLEEEWLSACDEREKLLAL